jgi:hypothetical protein
MSPQAGSSKKHNSQWSLKLKKVIFLHNFFSLTNFFLFGWSKKAV